jgi:hypothetical protein
MKFANAPDLDLCVLASSNSLLSPFSLHSVPSRRSVAVKNVAAPEAQGSVAFVQRAHAMGGEW